MTRTRTGVLGAGLALAVLTGCGGGASAPGSAAAGSSTRASSPSSAAPNLSGSSTSAGDVTLRGTVGGDGLTCVRFVATDGRRYALAGPGLPGRLVWVAQSLGRRDSLSSQPSGGQVASVTVVGHPVPAAKSTCSATVFSVTSAQVHSVTSK